MPFTFEYPPKISSSRQKKIDLFQYESIAVSVRMAKRNPKWMGDMAKADDEAKRELNELSLTHLGHASPYFTP